MPKKRKIYKVSPQEVHVRQCVHEHIVVRDGQVYYEKWLFRPDEFPCGKCGTSTTVVFMRAPVLNNVVRACTHCGITEPLQMRDPDTHQAIAVLLSDDESPRPLTDSEVRAFVKRNRIRPNMLHPFIKNLIERRPQKVVDIDKLELEMEE